FHEHESSVEFASIQEGRLSNLPQHLSARQGGGIQSIYQRVAKGLHLREVPPNFPTAELRSVEIDIGMTGFEVRQLCGEGGAVTFRRIPLARKRATNATHRGGVCRIVGVVVIK